MTDAPVFAGLGHPDTSVQVCILDRKGEVLVNRPCKNDREATTAVIAGHFAKPRVDVAGS